MGIDTEYWLLARSAAPLEVAAPTVEYLDSPDLQAAWLLSRLRAADPGCDRDRVASGYLKNSMPQYVAGAMDAVADDLLRGEDDRLVLLASVDGDYVAISWRRRHMGQPFARAEHGLDWREMPATFVPEEPALCCAVFTHSTVESAGLKLARALDARFKEGVLSSLTSGELFFWSQPLTGLKGVAIATQKFATHAGACAPIVFAYQTAIEGCFAWVCLPERKWPVHVRLPFSFANAPGDLLR